MDVVDMCDCKICGRLMSSGGGVHQTCATKANKAIKSVDKFNKRWDDLKSWIKWNRVNITCGDRFWDGYNEYHGELKDKIEELEKVK